MKRDAGFTAVEILVATAAALLILAGLVGVSQAEHRLFDRESRSLALREASRRILDMIAREIRGAGFDPLTTGSFDGGADGISVAGSDHIELRADRQGLSSSDPPDGMLDPDSGERISFYRNASRQAVYQSVGQQVLPLIDGVIVPTNGFQLRYFDGCNREIVASGELSDADRARIRRVSIILMVSDPTGRGTVSAETAATVRNRASQCENPA